MVIKKKSTKWIISILLIVSLLVTSCMVYLSIHYSADTSAIDAFMYSDLVTVDERRDFTAFVPAEPTGDGFIFYPGGKVESKAYYPLMHALATSGIFSAVVNVPFHLAIFDTNAATDVQKAFPNIEHWFIGGHSLGGAMAASHLSKNTDKFLGLVLLGAYSTKDISSSDISVLLVYGSEDKVMNKEKYDSCTNNLPKNFSESIIDGGNHAYFGMYGEQKGDGNATISNEDQIYTTADKIIHFIILHG